MIIKGGAYMMPNIKEPSPGKWPVKANSPYIDQVRLLVRLLPSAAKQACFALKGGTAINLFLRDMPRV